jgi:hypothetical protein
MVVRWGLEMAGGNSWSVANGPANRGNLAALLFGYLVLAGILALAWRLRAAPGKKGGRWPWAAWFWIVVGLALFCCGGAWVTAPLAAGLITMLDALPSAWHLLGLGLIGTWAINGAALGLAEGAALALAAAGRPATARRIHWTLVAVIILLTLFGVVRPGA